jgi:hypothetical protein
LKSSKTNEVTFSKKADLINANIWWILHTVCAVNIGNNTSLKCKYITNLLKLFFGRPRIMHLFSFGSQQKYLVPA